MKAVRLSVHSVSSDVARTVAVRLAIADQRDFAEAVARLERADWLTVEDHLRVASVDHVEVVSLVSLLEHRSARWQPHAGHPCCELLDRRLRQRTEHRNPLQKRHINVPGSHTTVKDAQRAPAREHAAA